MLPLILKDPFLKAAKPPPLYQGPLRSPWTFREEELAGLGGRKRDFVLDDIDPRVTLMFL